MKRTFLIAVMSTMPVGVYADATGAGDAAIVQQLVTLVKSANEQFRELVKSVSISENLESMEQAKAIKRIAAEGQAMRELIRETETLEGQITDLQDDPLGSRRTEREVSGLENALESAKQRDDRGQAKAYSRMLADMKRLQFLGKAQKESMKKVAQGTNETDNTEVAATSSMIMSDLMLQNERREQARRAQEVQAINETLGSMRYSTINMDDREDD